MVTRSSWQHSFLIESFASHISILSPGMVLSSRASEVARVSDQCASRQLTAGLALAGPTPTLWRHSVTASVTHLSVSASPFLPSLCFWRKCHAAEGLLAPFSVFQSWRRKKIGPQQMICDVSGEAADCHGAATGICLRLTWETPMVSKMGTINLKEKEKEGKYSGQNYVS